MRKRILVYNNQTHITEALTHLFLPEEIDFCRISDESLLLETFEAEQGDILIIDAFLQQLPPESGVELIRKLREVNNRPIIIVSDPVSESVKIQALGAGADDYVTTDVNPLELMARVKVQITRYGQLVAMQNNINQIYCINDLVVNDRGRKVTVSGREVELTPIEYKILRLLLEQRGKVLGSNEIYESIWQAPPIGAGNTIPVHIRHIREKIEEDPRKPKLLKAVWGIGYKIG